EATIYLDGGAARRLTYPYVAPQGFPGRGVYGRLLLDIGRRGSLPALRERWDRSLHQRAHRSSLQKSRRVLVRNIGRISAAAARRRRALRRRDQGGFRPLRR